MGGVGGFVLKMNGFLECREVVSHLDAFFGD